MINNGPNAGESVPHLHLHILGGRQLAWPPRLTRRFLHFPPFSEKARIGNAARSARIYRDCDIDDGVIRKFGNLARVVQIVVFAKSKSAVQHNIFFRIQRIGKM